jgi:hypothetical protein
MNEEVGRKKILRSTTKTSVKDIDCYMNKFKSKFLKNTTICRHYALLAKGLQP